MNVRSTGKAPGHSNHGDGFLLRLRTGDTRFGEFARRLVAYRWFDERFARLHRARLDTGCRVRCRARRRFVDACALSPLSGKVLTQTGDRGKIIERVYFQPWIERAI